MQEAFQIALPLIDAPFTSADEIAFAERAALYLEKQGLGHGAVVQALIDELDLDMETAEALADLAA